MLFCNVQVHVCVCVCVQGEVSDAPIIDSPLRNLSAWRVSIPEVQLKPDPDNPKKTIFVFAIEVRRVDVLESTYAFLLLFLFLHLSPEKCLFLIIQIVFFFLSFSMSHDDC